MTTPGRTKTKEGKSVLKVREIDHLPDVYQDFIKRYPDISKAYDVLADRCQQGGPLDKKNQRLIKLGIAIGINSEGSVRSHTRRAVEEGISPEEIRQVVLLASTTIGFPLTIAAYKWVEEVLKKAL